MQLEITAEHRRDLKQENFKRSAKRLMPSPFDMIIVIWLPPGIFIG